MLFTCRDLAGDLTAVVIWSLHLSVSGDNRQLLLMCGFYAQLCNELSIYCVCNGSNTIHMVLIHFAGVVCVWRMLIGMHRVLTVEGEHCGFGECLTENAAD